MMNKSLNPHDLGTFTVEECQKIDINGVLENVRPLLKQALLQSHIEILGYEIQLVPTKTNNGGLRLWFECPLCSENKGVLYKHPINSLVGCRQCLNLIYKNQRYKGMVENELEETEY